MKKAELKKQIDELQKQTMNANRSSSTTPMTSRLSAKRGHWE